jgi:hypothetical protein
MLPVGLSLCHPSGYFAEMLKNLGTESCVSAKEQMFGIQVLQSLWIEIFNIAALIGLITGICRGKSR